MATITTAVDDAGAVGAAVPAAVGAVVFPGQGVPRDAILADLARHGDAELVHTLAARLGTDDWASLDFTDTRASTPCVFVTGLLNALEAVPASYAGVTMGHSLGEITAMAFAGTFSPSDGLELVLRRGELCHEVQARRPGAMAAVMGLPVLEVDWHRRCAAAATGAFVELAAMNGTKQVVVSGDVAGVDQCIQRAASAGAAIARLPIGGAFHSPLLVDAVDRYRDAVQAMTVRPPRLTVVSGIDCAVHTDPAELLELLVRGLVLPVRWLEALGVLRDLGVTAAWEAGPGRTLSRIGKRERVVEFLA